MKLLYDASFNGSQYVLTVTVLDKGILDTDKIFVHRSADDLFIKICSLSEIKMVPETRFAAEYYRKNNATILVNALYEASEIKEMLNQQANSLATEAESLREFYSSETAITYPLKVTEPKNEVDSLYSEYVKIKNDRDVLISQRTSIKSQRDATESDYNYVDSLLSPITSKISGGIDIEDYSKVMSSIMSLKSAVSSIMQQINNIKSAKDICLDKSKIEKYNEDINSMVWWLQKKYYEILGLNSNIISSCSEVIKDLQTAIEDMNSAGSSLESVENAINTVSSIKVNASDNSIETYPLLSDSAIMSIVSEVQMLVNKIKENQVMLNTMSVMVNTIKEKYRKSLSELDKQLITINSKIDSYNNALDELKSQILDKNPDFDLQLF